MGVWELGLIFEMLKPWFSTLFKNSSQKSVFDKKKKISSIFKNKILPKNPNMKNKFLVLFYYALINTKQKIPCLL